MTRRKGFKRNWVIGGEREGQGKKNLAGWEIAKSETTLDPLI